MINGTWLKTVDGNSIYVVDYPTHQPLPDDVREKTDKALKSISDFIKANNIKINFKNTDF